MSIRPTLISAGLIGLALALAALIISGISRFVDDPPPADAPPGAPDAGG